MVKGPHESDATTLGSSPDSIMAAPAELPLETFQLPPSSTKRAPAVASRPGVFARLTGLACLFGILATLSILAIEAAAEQPFLSSSLPLPSRLPSRRAAICNEPIVAIWLPLQEDDGTQCLSTQRLPEPRRRPDSKEGRPWRQLWKMMSAM